MALDWMPRDNELKDHALHTDVHWGKDEDAPCVVYEKRPLKDPKGNVQKGLYVAWIRLNNPKQYNSYTTEMVKGVIAGFENCFPGQKRDRSCFYRYRPLFVLHRR